MREEMMKDEEDKEKIDKDDERLNRKIAERIGKSDDKEVEKEEPSQEKLEDERPKKKSRQEVKEADEDEDFEVVNKWHEQVRKEQADRGADTGGAKSSRSGGIQEEESAKRRKKGDEDGDCILDLTEGFNFEKGTDRKRVYDCWRRCRLTWWWAVLFVGQVRLGLPANDTFDLF
jgi:hypothetical protein